MPPQPVLLIALAGLGMVGPFTIDTIFPAFAQMAIDLDVSPFALQQMLSVYLLSFAVMSLFHGPLSDALGRKPVIVAGLAFYTLASVGCALAPDLTWLLVLRAVQGASAGAGQIISRAMVSDLFVRDRAQRVMAQIAMIFGLAPAAAPIVGGWLLLAGDWRNIFWFLAGLGVVLIALTVAVLPESHPLEERTPLRVGPLLASLWAVVRTPNGRRLAVIGGLTFAGMFLYISSAPMFIVTMLGGGEQDFWHLFVPLIGGLVAGSWMSGRLAGRVPGRRVASLGFTIALVGGLLNLALAAIGSTQHLPWIVLALPLYTFGIALTIPTVTLEMLAEFPHTRGAASSVQSFVQLLFNALIAGLVAPAVAVNLPSLAGAALGFTVLGALGWAWHLRSLGRAAA